MLCGLSMSAQLTADVEARHSPASTRSSFSTPTGPLCARAPVLRVLVLKRAPGSSASLGYHNEQAAARGQSPAVMAHAQLQLLLQLIQGSSGSGYR